MNKTFYIRIFKENLKIVWRQALMSFLLFRNKILAVAANKYAKPACRYKFFGPAPFLLFLSFVSNI